MVFLLYNDYAATFSSVAGRALHSYLSLFRFRSEEKRCGKKAAIVSHIHSEMSDLEDLIPGARVRQSFKSMAGFSMSSWLRPFGTVFSFLSSRPRGSWRLGDKFNMVQWCATYCLLFPGFTEDNTVGLATGGRMDMEGVWLRFVEMDRDAGQVSERGQCTIWGPDLFCRCGGGRREV